MGDWPEVGVVGFSRKRNNFWDKLRGICGGAVKHQDHPRDSILDRESASQLNATQRFANMQGRHSEHIRAVSKAGARTYLYMILAALPKEDYSPV